MIRRLDPLFRYPWGLITSTCLRLGIMSGKNRTASDLIADRQRKGSDARHGDESRRKGMNSR